MRVVLSLICATSVLAACGGGSSGGGSDEGNSFGGIRGSDTVSQLGFINVDQLGDESTIFGVGLSGNFISSSSPINLGPLTNELKPNSDTCDVREDVGFFDDLEEDITGLNFEDITTISAGETITFTSSGGTFATMNRQTQFGFTGYDLELDNINTVPTDLIVSIPGDEFPAFSTIAVPVVPTLTGLNISTDDVITADSTITWAGRPNSGTSLEISVSIDNDFTDFSDATTTEIDCYVLDDGSFTFPASVRSQIGSQIAFEFSIVRNNYSIVESGIAVLIVSSTSGN